MLIKHPKVMAKHGLAINGDMQTVQPWAINPGRYGLERMSFINVFTAACDVAFANMEDFAAMAAIGS